LPEPNREVFRLTPPLILWWVWVAFAVLNVADFAIQGTHGTSARFEIGVCAILVTVTGLAYALALRPHVVAEPGGLTIVNPFRDHHVPWAAIESVDTQDWVRVHRGGGKPISCWALYVSARTKRRSARLPAGAEPAAKRFAGGLPNPRLPGSQTAGSRLPTEAKYLASLPAARAIAVRLDTRASRERARTGPSEPGSPFHPVTATWAWPPVAAVTLPALALLIVALS